MKKISKFKLIYNPNAGKKRKLVSSSTSLALEDIFTLLDQYQIEYDPAPTTAPGDATKLAKSAVKEGYTHVLAAGGDGTIEEVANGLVGSDVTLGILPMGTYMNVARMLSIPLELEKAVALIKIGRTRKVDVGCITHLDGDKLSAPHYFLESASVGLEAQLQENFLKLERGNLSAIIDMYKTVNTYFWDKFNLVVDDKEKNVRASMITVANGPFSGAALEISPDAKLNDHHLTVTIFRMNNWDLLMHFISLSGLKTKTKTKKETTSAHIVSISSKNSKPLHADARVFGTTPARFSVIPGALSFICGFPKPDEAYLGKRTVLDP
jgi:YegS/Rv2252/BmrU family lipid kinase